MEIVSLVQLNPRRSPQFLFFFQLSARLATGGAAQSILLEEPLFLVSYVASPNKTSPGGLKAFAQRV